MQTNIVIEKVSEPPIVEKLEPTIGSDCIVEDGYVKCNDLGLTVNDMKSKLTSGSVLPVKFFKHAEGSDELIELSDTDIVGTGIVVMVGESKWTAIISADLDGNGKLTINDIVLFKLDYIGEKALEGPYLMAAEIDGRTLDDGTTSINDLVLMLFKYNDISIDD